MHPATLDMEDKPLVECLHTLIMDTSNEVTVDVTFSWYTYLLTNPLHPNVGHKATMSLLHR